MFKVFAFIFFLSSVFATVCERSGCTDCLIHGRCYEYSPMGITPQQCVVYDGIDCSATCSSIDDCKLGWVCSDGACIPDCGACTGCYMQGYCYDYGSWLQSPDHCGYYGGFDCSTNTPHDENGLCKVSQRELSQKWWDIYGCQDMQEKFEACTTESSPYHESVIDRCPATCANAVADSCPTESSCPLDDEESSQMWWNSLGCKDMQDKFEACTRESSPYHQDVMDRCPATCADARDALCPTKPSHSISCPFTISGFEIQQQFNGLYDAREPLNDRVAYVKRGEFAIVGGAGCQSFECPFTWWFDDDITDLVGPTGDGILAQVDTYNTELDLFSGSTVMMGREWGEGRWHDVEITVQESCAPIDIHTNKVQCVQWAVDSFYNNCDNPDSYAAQNCAGTCHEHLNGKIEHPACNECTSGDLPTWNCDDYVDSSTPYTCIAEPEPCTFTISGFQFLSQFNGVYDAREPLNDRIAYVKRGEFAIVGGARCNSRECPFKWWFDDDLSDLVGPSGDGIRAQIDTYNTGVDLFSGSTVIPGREAHQGRWHDVEISVQRTCPTKSPTVEPTLNPVLDPTVDPTIDPTANPTIDPTADPTLNPVLDPTSDPTSDPTFEPSLDPTVDPTLSPTFPECEDIPEWEAGFGECSTYSEGTRNHLEGCNADEVGTNGVPAIHVCSECKRCYVDCEGSWSDYGTCSQTCGGGIQTRVFTVTTPAQLVGMTCDFPQGFTQERACNVQNCPVDCSGAWGNFGPCSATCGGGTQTREYLINQPALFGGAECDQAGSVESRFCNIDSCLRPQTQTFVECFDRSCENGLLECMADCAYETYATN